MQKYKATMYVRLSYTDDKSSESDSIVNQRKLIQGFLKDYPDIQLVSEKVDDGYSGIIFDRPAFQEMMKDIADGKINCVIVKDLSRLGREYIEMGRYLRRIFPAYGVRFIAINDNIDTARDANMDDLTISVKNIMNDAYCRDISVKTRSALATKRNNGDFVGASTIYGYRKSPENKNQLVIDDYAASIVQDIYKMRIEGVSAYKIADQLNQSGVLSPIEYKRNKGLPFPTGGFADRKNSLWSATTIIRILKDEMYTGTLLQGKKTTFSYKLKDVVDKPATEWARTEDAHDPIISKHDFNLVQRIMLLDTRTSPNESKVYLFSGILICGCCGNNMSRKSVPYKGKQYLYYFCPTGKKNGCHTPTMIRETDLVACVADSIKSHIDNVVSLEDLLSKVCKDNINRDLIKKYTAQIREAEKQQEQINQFRSSLYENYLSGLITKEEYRNYKNTYSVNYQKLEGAIKKLKQELEDARDNKSEQLRWMENFKQLATLQNLDRKTVIQFVQSIRIVDKTQIQILFNYQLEYDQTVQLLTGKTEAI